jgi:predicted KAP-like P-loop ATPase
MNYSSDSPVDNQNEDKFSRWNFSARIAQVIAERKDPGSIVIGLYGAWGDGKTSVLNFIQKSLETTENVICISFNPWRFGSEDELLMGLFSDIAKAVDEDLKTNRDKLAETLEKSSPVVGGFLGMLFTYFTGVRGLDKLINIKLPRATVSEFKQRTEERLEKHKKRILILVDDIDRLDKSEIYSLFRLVKLTANLNYTAYLLAFDKGVVTASLEDRYPNAKNNPGESFLEKIIQIPLNLPSADKSALKEFCLQGINEALRISGTKLTPQQEQEFARNFTCAFDYHLTTPRKAKLYGNSLMFSLPILRGEINIVDMMLIEGIRVFCSPLYDTIRSNKSSFAGVFQGDEKSEDDKERIRTKELIDKALINQNSISKEGYIELLKNIFPRIKAVYKDYSYNPILNQEWDVNQQVCSESYFSRYFTYSISEEDISDEVISNGITELKIWKCSFDEPSNPLKKILTEKNIASLIRKLQVRINDLSDDELLPLAVALSLMSDSYPDSKTLSIDNSFNYFNRAAMIVSHAIQSIQSIEKQKNAARECIRKSTSLGFKILIFRYLMKKEKEQAAEKGWFSNDDANEIEEFLATETKEALSQNVDFTEIPPSTMRATLHVLNKYGHGSFLRERSQNNPELVLAILNSFRQAWGELGSNSLEWNPLTKNDYNAIIKYLGFDIVMKASNQLGIEIAPLGKEFPMSNSDSGTEDKDSFYQFIWLHNKIMSVNE